MLASVGDFGSEMDVRHHNVDYLTCLYCVMTLLMFTKNVMTIIGDNHDIAVIIETSPICETYVVATSRPKADCSSIQLIMNL